MGNCQQICPSLGQQNAQYFHPLTSFKTDSQSPQQSYAQFTGTKYYQIPPSVTSTLDLFTNKSFSQSEVRGKLLEGYYYIKQLGIYYKGQWKSGLPHGSGDIIFADGSVLYGWFNGGKCEGLDCLYAMINGSYYRGSIRNNLFNGKGTLIDKQKYEYDGEWVDNFPHGEGKQKFLGTGDTFEGIFDKGRKTGQGVYKWGKSSGYAKYEGSFVNNKIMGNGKLLKKNGDVIEGYFQDNKVRNVHIVDKECDFTGQLIMGYCQGNGTIKYRDGKEFNGKFVKGIPHGEGSITDKNITRKGKWFEGKMLSNYQNLSDQKIRFLLNKIEQSLKNNKYCQQALVKFEQLIKVNPFKANFKASFMEKSLSIKITVQRYLLIDIGSFILLVSEQ